MGSGNIATGLWLLMQAWVVHIAVMQAQAAGLRPTQNLTHALEVWL